MITSLIREATSEQEVFGLLNAFMEASLASGKLSRLPAGIAAPASGFDDLMRRCLALLSEIDAASRRPDDAASAVIKEVLQVFGSALDRLKLLEHEARRACAQRAHARNDAERSASPAGGGICAEPGTNPATILLGSSLAQ